MTVSVVGATPWLLEATVAHVCEVQHSCGGWMVPPDPRILETALACHALAALNGSDGVGGAIGEALSRARQWLVTARAQCHVPVAEVIERALRAIALGSEAAVDLINGDFDTPVHSSRMLLVHAVALHAGREVSGPLTSEQLREVIAVRYARYERENLKPWSAVELLAVRALVESYFGQEDAAAEARARIKSRQDGDGSFFQNPISTSMALLALRAAGMSDPSVRRCCQWLLDAQQPDGTWRFCICDVWDTTLVIRAFGGHPVFREQAMPRALDYLCEMQNDDGGWGFGGHAQSDNDTTGAALLALPANGQHKEQIARAVDYLARQQTRDGLWRTWQFNGDSPAQDTIAHVIAALDRVPEYHRIPLEPARHWLIRQYAASRSGWRPCWYHNGPYALLEVGRALGFSHPLVQRAARTMASAQNPDGGWGRVTGEESCASATGLALAALTRCNSTDGGASLAAAVDYLARSQRSDGTWPGVPEMVGPRPLLTHMPIETQAFAAMGLASLPSGERRGPLHEEQRP